MSCAQEARVSCSASSIEILFDLLFSRVPLPKECLPYTKTHHVLHPSSFALLFSCWSIHDPSYHFSTHLLITFHSLWIFYPYLWRGKNWCFCFCLHLYFFVIRGEYVTNFCSSPSIPLYLSSRIGNGTRFAEEGRPNPSSPFSPRSGDEETSGRPGECIGYC